MGAVASWGATSRGAISWALGTSVPSGTTENSANCRKVQGANARSARPLRDLVDRRG